MAPASWLFLWIILFCGALSFRPILAAENAKISDPWSWKPVANPAIPAISRVNGDGAQNPIDNFVVQKLEQNGMTISPEATEAVLVRRIY
ncbi:MAG: hypothetical protein ACO1QB_05005, partial [Verrucomicrobiales bacterium]